MSEDERPDAVEQLTTALRDFVGAEGVLARAQRTRERAEAVVIERVAQLREAAEAVHDPVLIAAVRHIYWQQRGIGSRALADAAGLTVNEMLQAIGPCPSGVLCAACGQDIPRTSRSWTSPGRYGPPLCSECESAKRDLQTRGYQVERLRANLIGAAPVEAAARDWYAAAALVLEYPPVAQGVSSGSERDRQEGVWTGWNNARAVKGRLDEQAPEAGAPFAVAAASAKKLLDAAWVVAGWDSARTRDVLDPITEDSAHLLLTRLRRALTAAVDVAKQRAQQVFQDDHVPSEDEIRALWDAPFVWWVGPGH
ncbi:hypothetical protein RM780_25345 [Streptomyces sp. DSM 44917]|uniref:Uncharacterized protein n=1 Tax=Streptomyces boetiae TaxID=3075541 RepID=A0ABU2LGH2_9ACTN|nr:hypothetical protein [Streptomyces sp. DSM 44917]MDT0310253.1 hypothetical protein [Streptomyces sp. DSM 44917]